MVKAVIFTILFVSVQSFGANNLVGNWESKYLEDVARGTFWQFQRISFTPTNFVLSVKAYERSDSKEPMFEVETTGTYKTSVNRINDKVIDLDMVFTKHTFILRKITPLVKNLNIAGCASLNKEMDVIKDGCGAFLIQKNARNFFTSALLIDDRSMVMGSWINFPGSESLRPKIMSIYPLVRK